MPKWMTAHFLLWILLPALLAGERVSFAADEKPFLNAKSAVILNASNGHIIFSKEPHLPLPPASTAKVMTALLALERLPLDKKVRVSSRAFHVSPSKAGLSFGAEYSVRDLLIALLVSSSNDAAVTLAEATAGSEQAFASLMNERAKELGMRDTCFVNATGLTDKRRRQCSTAYDLARLMWVAARKPCIDRIMGIPTAVIYGSDGKAIFVRNHNKMLWRTPNFVKGKTGWTNAARHTFIGTDYSADKKIMFALLSSDRPWIDIQHLATFGLLLGALHR